MNMVKQRADKGDKKPSIKRHKLKTSKKLVGVRTLRIPPECTGLTFRCPTGSK